jgi:uncharacterized membrane protein
MLDVLINQSEDKQSNKKMLRFSDRADKPIKSLIKAFSWRVVGTIDTMIISYFITGKVMMAVSIGGVEVFSKTVLYYFHERIWAHIHRIRRFNLLKSRHRNAEQIEYEVKGIKRAAVR